jgi:hypothetical protein
MTRVSLVNMGLIFLVITFIFSGVWYSYGLANNNGYNTDGLNETIFNDIGDESKVQEYLNETKTIQDSTQADTNSFDVIGQLISTALAPVRIIISGANFLITNIGKLLNYIGIPSIVSDFVAGLLVYIISTIFLFAVVLGRRDKID